MSESTEEVPDKVMQAATRIVKSLNTSNKDTEDMIRILSSFDNRLSNITDLMSDSRFDSAEKLILSYSSTTTTTSRHSLSFDDSPHAAAEYLSAVDQILNLIDDLSFESDPQFIDRAENALQLAMAKLEDEFCHILISNTQQLNADRLYGSISRVSSSFGSVCGEIIGDLSSFGGGEDCFRESSLDDACVDLIYPQAVSDLRDIADRMLRSGYEKECCQVYCSVCRNVLEECMAVLGVDRLSIKEVERTEWKEFDDKIKKWVQAVKIVVRVLLSAEKQLCDRIFCGSDLIKEVCFVETSKGCVLQLLNFGEAVAIGKRSPEKLFPILDMYDVLKDVLPDLQVLFKDESGELVCSQAKGVLHSLGETAIGTFVEFDNAVQSEQSKLKQGHEIHPLARYVMNYAKIVADYSGTLNTLLKDGDWDEPETSKNDDNDANNFEFEESTSPMACRLLALMTALELKLEENSRMYEDGAMQYIFLMNNILYIVQKVKDSELRKLLGDNWVRKRCGQIRQCATSYLRSSWSKPLACLKEEGIGGSSSNAYRVALKEKLKNFNACFEDIYRIQTAWKVPDAQLREELRLSISEKVIPAYRSFMGRFGSQLEIGRQSGKYIKYTPEDLENYLVDLFEGTPLVLHHMRRKGT